MGFLDAKVRPVRIAATLAGVAAATMAFKKDIPTHGEPHPSPAHTEVLWDVQTKAALEKLSNDFAHNVDGLFSNSSNDTGSESSFVERKKRFIDFARTYAPEMHIAEIGNEQGLGKRMYSFTQRGISKIAGQPNAAAFYGRKTIYQYAQDSHQTFIAELSHYLNGDEEIRRIARYLVDFSLSVGRKESLYDEPRAVEFQAHSITQPIIHLYLQELYHGKPSSELLELLRKTFLLYSEIVSQKFSFNAEAHLKIFVKVHVALLAKTSSLSELISTMSHAVNNLKSIQMYMASSTAAESKKSELLFLIARSGICFRNWSYIEQLMNNKLSM
jgi:hypothetical protein